MKKLILKRFYMDDTTTLGCLTCDELKTPLYTCENVWKNNQRNISCIPSGEYKIKPYVSPHFRNCITVLDIKDREFILFHPGNTHKDTRGCILPGLEAGTLKGLPAVLNSREAFEILKNIVTEECNLLIFPFE